MLGVFIFVKNNIDKFDFNGLDNGIPVHKYAKEFKELGGHGNHPEYSSITREMIVKIKNNSFENGKFRQKLFEKNLLEHIAKTRQDIIEQVVNENKKINDLKFSK